MSWAVMAGEGGLTLVIKHGERQCRAPISSATPVRYGPSSRTVEVSIAGWGDCRAESEEEVDLKVERRGEALAAWERAELNSLWLPVRRAIPQEWDGQAAGGGGTRERFRRVGRRALRSVDRSLVMPNRHP